MIRLDPTRASVKSVNAVRFFEIKVVSLSLSIRSTVCFLFWILLMQREDDLASSESESEFADSVSQ